MLNRTATRVAFWLLAAAIAVLSLLPGESLPDVTSSVWDKAQHAGGFAALAVTGLLAYGARQPWRVMLGLLAFGVLIEFAQSATGWRHGDPQDVLADAAGLAIGQVGLVAIRRWRSTLRAR